DDQLALAIGTFDYRPSLAAGDSQKLFAINASKLDWHDDFTPRRPELRLLHILAHSPVRFNSALYLSARLVTMEGRGWAFGEKPPARGAVLVPCPPTLRVPIMHSSRSRFRPAGPAGALLIVITIFLTAPALRAQHIVYLKDGTALHGRVITQKERYTDPNSGVDYSVFNARGFFLVGDGCRAVIFSTRNLDPTRGDFGTEIDDTRQKFQLFQRDYPRPTRPTPEAGVFDPSKPNEWNARGERTLILRTPMGKEPI